MIFNIENKMETTGRVLGSPNSVKGILRRESLTAFELLNSYEEAGFVLDYNSAEILFFNDQAKKLFETQLLQNLKNNSLFDFFKVHQLSKNFGQITFQCFSQNIKFAYLCTTSQFDGKDYQFVFLKQCGEQSLQNSSASNEKNQDDIDKIIFTIKQEDHSVEDNPLLSNGSEVEKQIEEKIDLVSHSDCAVLISGETGVGKERVAKRIHQLSGRKNGPWVAVNCAAIPAELFESEFFGYQKGAFTGAVRDHLGYFREAHGGTLFLDEIGELPLSQQCKLLRVIQEGEVRAVGSCNQQKIDVRIIAATNRNLAKEVEEEKFRRDLFYRINVIPIEIPPLRERRDDIAILAKAFIEKEIRSKALDSMAVSKAQWQNLLSYDWPGNIRQLGHEIERSILLGLKTKELTFFASSITGCGGSIAVNEDDVSSAEYSKLVQILNDSKDIDNKVFPLVETIKALEKILIVRALKKSSGRIYGSKGAADLLGVKGTTLASKIQKLDI